MVIEPPPTTESEPFAAGVADCGGILVPLNSSQVADVALVHVNVEDPAPPCYDLRKVRAREIVTTIWTAECLNDLAINPVHFYHRPLPAYVYEKNKLLEGCVIVPTNIIGGLRDYVKLTANLLGAT